MAAKRRREPDGPVYSFPTRVRCPRRRCRSTRTLRYSAALVRDGARQYRVCLACGLSFSVRGLAI